LGWLGWERDRRGKICSIVTTIVVGKISKTTKTIITTTRITVAVAVAVAVVIAVAAVVIVVIARFVQRNLQFGRW
jgi:hypothetical protein